MIKLIRAKLGNGFDTQGTCISEALIFSKREGVLTNFWAIVPEGVIMVSVCETLADTPFWYSTMLYPNYFKTQDFEIDAEMRDAVQTLLLQEQSSKDDGFVKQMACDSFGNNELEFETLEQAMEYLKNRSGK